MLATNNSKKTKANRNFILIGMKPTSTKGKKKAQISLGFLTYSIRDEIKL